MNFDHTDSSVLTTVFLSLVLAAAGGCSSSGGSGTPAKITPDAGSGPDTTRPDTQGSDTADGGDEDTGNDVPTYQTIYSGLNSKYGCSGSYCHGDSAPEIDTRDKVVGVASECNGTPLVDPGKPANSLLYRKVDPGRSANQVCGSKMPKGSSSLSSSEAETIRRWIAAVAP
ncbi:MAG: hypothetical protein ABEL76_10290 [Bradymonadaceae bacterium]